MVASTMAQSRYYQAVITAFFRPGTTCLQARTPLVTDLPRFWAFFPQIFLYLTANWLTQTGCTTIFQPFGRLFSYLPARSQERSSSVRFAGLERRRYNKVTMSPAIVSAAGPHEAGLKSDRVACPSPSELRRYQTVDTRQALFELAVTAVPFVAVWVCMSLALQFDQPWLYALLLLPASGLLVRLFMIQHDCGHGAFLAGKTANDWLGRIISALTLAPYDLWRRSHAMHHATSGNLDRRGVGDIDTITVAEYRERSWWGRLGYRLYRNPFVLFGLGPIYYFMLQNRLPVGFMRKGWWPWASTMATNVAIAAVSGLAIWAVGLHNFILVQVPVWILASAIGVWLFYVQHQFERVFWSKDHGWNMRDAALHGSSHYDLPAVLRWFTANIGIHHAHHLSGRIPYYRLPEVMRDFPALADVNRLTLWTSIKTVRLSLWDEGANRLVSFSHASSLGR